MKPFDSRNCFECTVELHVGECSFEVVPAQELIESVDELRTALNDPSELENLVRSVGPKLEEHSKNGHQLEAVRLRS